MARNFALRSLSASLSPRAGARECETRRSNNLRSPHYDIRREDRRASSAPVAHACDGAHAHLARRLLYGVSGSAGASRGAVSAIAEKKMRWCTKTNEVLGGRARGTTVEAAAAARLQVGALAQAADRRAHLRGLRSVHRVRAAREHLFARLALPDPHRRPLHGVLPAEEAREARVLGDLDLLHLLAERRAVPDTVLAGDPDLLCPLLRLRGAGAGGSAGCRESGAASRVRAGSGAPELRRAARWV